MFVCVFHMCICIYIHMYVFIYYQEEHIEEASLAGLGVSYKRQHFAARLRKFPGTVQGLFEYCINPRLADRLFRILVR